MTLKSLIGHVLPLHVQILSLIIWLMLLLLLLMMLLLLLLLLVLLLLLLVLLLLVVCLHVAQRSTTTLTEVRITIPLWRVLLVFKLILILTEGVLLLQLKGS